MTSPFSRTSSMAAASAMASASLKVAMSSFTGRLPAGVA
jgi:hypothetical protein